jgi:hypothetical protein
MLPSSEPVWEDNRKSLAELTVGEILELYKSDTELLKHVLTAKAEEDKVIVLYCCISNHLFINL